MADTLADMRCIPCKGNVEKIPREEVTAMLQEVPGWNVIEVDGEDRLQRVFKFDDFKEALDFTNDVGRIAEENDHHPAILTEWGRVTVSWWTHKVKGLFQNDFIMAAKTDALAEKVP